MFSNQELQLLTDKLVDRAGAFDMEVTTDKRNVMVNSINTSNASISMNTEQTEASVVWTCCYA